MAKRNTFGPAEQKTNSKSKLASLKNVSSADVTLLRKKNSNSNSKTSICRVLDTDLYRMGEHSLLMQTHEAVVDLITGRPSRLDLVYNVMHREHGLDFGYYGMSSDDDDEDYEKSRHNDTYCGLLSNFLDRGVSKPQKALPFRTAKYITPEEAAKNATELVVEEEKLKKKAEKKKQKKMRQRERRRLEKMEKENANKDSEQQVDPGSEKCKPAQKNDKKNKTNISPPPDPGPQSTLATTESCDSSDEEDDEDDKESVAVEPEELDMNSCFVTNAAAIAKRKLEQKPKADRKDKKSENSKKHVPEEKKTVAPHTENASETASDQTINDPVTKSMELAVIGNTYAQTGDLDKAVHFFTEAIKYNPQEYKLFGNRSFCYEKMQQYEKALIDADIALSLDPTWIKGLYRKGKALVGLKRYYEAGLTYKEVLKLDTSCTDAAQELMRVQIMQLMDMGYTREESSNALIIHGTVEKALDALSVLHGNMATTHLPSQVLVKQDKVFPEQMPQLSNVPFRAVSQNQPRVITAAVPTNLELFPVWVGDLVPAVSAPKIHELFSTFGHVHSIKILSTRRCAFVNYTKKEDCEKAIKTLNGYAIAGTNLVVRYPDRIHTHLGVSKTAATDTVKTDKLPDECYFWRTTGCIKNDRCTYKHVPEHKGIDRGKVKR